MKSYDALPCRLMEFTINGIKADQNDFGEETDLGWGEREPEPYACGNMQFESYPTPPEGVLEKYGINLEEYHEICEKLENQLFVGECGWCV